MLRAQAYIRRHLDDPALSVQSIADSVELTENYLSGLYKRETGENLHHVITDLRMERARYLLLHGWHATDVAQRCGYSSFSYFHSVFRRQTGMTHADFARRNGREQEP